MPKGGKRPGAGRKRGSPDKKTVEKRVAEEQYRRFMLAHGPALWRAQLEKALGVFVCVVQGKDGLYKRLTDPAQIAAVMARATRGDGYYLIEALPPDTQMAKEVNVRCFGMPAQPVDLGLAEGAGRSVRIVLEQLK